MMRFKSIRYVGLLVLAGLLAGTTAANAVEAVTGLKKIVLIAGTKSHGPGDHEYEKGVKLLKHCLDTSPNVKGVKTEVYLDGWPQDPAVLEDADTILFYCDGSDRNEKAHPLLKGDRMATIDRLMQRGVGFVAIHYAVFIPAQKGGDQYLDWMGGYFDYENGSAANKWYSKIETKDYSVHPATPTHPIARGLKSFGVKEEYYFNMRFREPDARRVPILTFGADNGDATSVVAWAVQRRDGGRGFGYTGGHFHKNWQNENVRRMVLNALLWTAKVEVPPGGVESTLPADEQAHSAGNPKTLIVTGHNHPAHNWRETTKALEEVLLADKQFRVEVTEDPEMLATANLKDYRLLMMNYCNWERPGLSEAAKKSFREFISSGGGLALIHFANGAFHFSLPGAESSDWPEYRRICRRVWDHTKGNSGHDPFGPFRVEITKMKHPITEGMTAFDTADELYFNQQGELPLEPLVTGHSKVTDKDEPLAFAYSYERGRVFQTLLGHDTEAIHKAGELIRRGSLWAAGNFSPVRQVDETRQKLVSARVTAAIQGDDLVLTWQGDETIEVVVSTSRGLFTSPFRIKVNNREVSLNGFYVHINGRTNGFAVESTQAGLNGNRIEVAQILRHPTLAEPTKINFTLWMEPQDRGLRVRVAVKGKDQHLDRLGLGDHQGSGLEAERMFFGRMYVLDKPQAFEHEHNYNSCRFWCWKMANGLTELQATGGPAKGFRFDPALGRYDLYTYCESPIQYVFFVSGKGLNEAIAEYRNTIQIPAPSTLSQLPGRVGVMTAYPIAERYEDFLEQWTGRGARDFVWLSYFPTPGDRQKVAPYSALYATYDLYLDYFAEGPRKATDWSEDKVQFRNTGKMVRGYWSSTWLRPELYVMEATQRVMGVFGHEFNDDEGKRGFTSSKATPYSNLAITRTEVGPNALYLDVHASKAPHHYFDSKGGHHGAREHMQGEKALFDFARQYLGNVPIWSEGGGEDYVGLMDGGWFMDYRPPEELGIKSAKWQYFPFLDLVHRERLLNMSIYYPPDHYDTNMVNLAVLFGRPQAVSLYYGTRQDDVGGRLQVYYMTKAFHRMLGLSRMERIDFQDDDINRCTVSYSNGARAWINRSSENWTVDDFRLPPLGYLVRGPGGFLEYRAIKNGEVADMVHCDEYGYFSCPKPIDFGPVITDGAIAVTRQGSDRLVVYEVLKPSGITLKLGELPGTDRSQRAQQAWAVLTRDRRVELTFPDLRQPTDPANHNKLGNKIQLRPVEMRDALRYEILLTANSVSQPK